MKTASKKEKRVLNSIMIFLSFLLVALYTFIWTKNSFILEIIAFVISSFLLLSDFYYVEKSRFVRKKSAKLMKEKNVMDIDKSPLESYLLKSIWNYKSVFISKKKFSSLLDYEIMIGHIVNNNEVLQIPSNLDLNSIDIYTKYVMETIFLDQTSIKRSEQFKIERLKNIQQKGIKIDAIEVNKNINSNLSYNSNLSFLVTAVKEKYFEERRSNIKIVIATLSYLVIVFNLIMMIVSIKQANPFNFYLPFSMSLIMFFLITNNYYEMLTLKTSKIEEVSDVLHYIDGLTKRKMDEEERKYAECIKHEERPVSGLLSYRRVTICGIIVYQNKE